VTDSQPDNGIPRQGAKPSTASSLLGKRHKVGRLTGFPDVRKVIRKPKTGQTSIVPTVTKYAAATAMVC